MEYSCSWYARNREKVIAKQTELGKTPERKAYQEAYRKTLTREKQNEYQRNYRAKHRQHVNDKARLDRKTNIQFKLRNVLRVRLNDALRKHLLKGSGVKLLGCSLESFRLYLEARFEPGMTWENHGRKGWHIDHIKPLASFDLTDPEQLKKACHYTNLQPLWEQDNLKKSWKVG